MCKYVKGTRGRAGTVLVGQHETLFHRTTFLLSSCFLWNVLFPFFFLIWMPVSVQIKQHTFVITSQ